MPVHYEQDTKSDFKGLLSTDASTVTTTPSLASIASSIVTPQADGTVRASPTLRVAMSLTSIVLLLFILLANTALAMFMRNMRSRRSNGTSLYISAIVITAMMAAFVGKSFSE